MCVICSITRFTTRKFYSINVRGCTLFAESTRVCKSHNCFQSSDLNLTLASVDMFSLDNIQTLVVFVLYGYWLNALLSNEYAN